MTERLSIHAMLAPVYLVAFSGHRPGTQPGRTEADLARAAPRLERVMRELVAKAADHGGEVHLVTSLAAGADVIACETAMRLEIPIHLVLSMPEAEFMETYLDADPANDFSHWLPRAYAILATIRADPAHPGIPLHPRHTLRVGAISTTSPECYAETNTRLIESADLLLTFSNLQPSKSIAGTTHLISQAEAIGVPVVNLNPAEPPDAPLPALPPEFASAGCRKLRIFQNLQPHIPTNPPTSRATFADLAEALGRAADQSSRWYRRATAIAIASHALATIIAAAAASFYFIFKSKDFAFYESTYWILAIIAFIEVILVGGGYFLERQLHKDQAQKSWLLCRFARELMRSLEKAGPFLDPLFPEIQRHLPEWKRFAITTALQLRSENPVPITPSPEKITTWRDEYLTHRVIDQERYFTRKAATANHTNHAFHKLTHWSGLCALIVIGLAFAIKSIHVWQTRDGGDAFKIWNDPITAILLLFLPIFMPLLVSLGASFGAAFDYSRRASRYSDISASLEHTARVLPTLHTWPDITSLVRQTEETLLDENIEWLSAQKKGLGH